MAQELDTVLVQDSRIHNISDKLKYGVMSGAASNTYQQFNSVSGSSSGLLSFSVRPPSESVVIDRNIYIGATISCNLTINVPAGVDVAAGGVADATNIFDWGGNISLQSFPLNRLFQTVTASINNCSISLNSQDVLPAIIRMMSTEKLQQYQYGTPTLLDNYANYTDMTTALNVANVSNNPMNSYYGGTANTFGANFNNKLYPRGCHPVTFGSVRFPVHVADPLSYNYTFARSGVLTQQWIVPITFTVYEPLILSPFLFGGFAYGKAGLIGINNINITCNLDQSMKRVFSQIPTKNVTYSFDSLNVSNAYIYLNILSTQPTTIIKPLNVLPFYDMPRYILGTTNTSNIAGPGVPVSMTVSNIQLNQIPDRILIYARYPIANSTQRISDTFLTISKISVNFNNVSGLLSTASPIQLWEMSQRNGLNMNWYDWSGQAFGQIGTIVAGDPATDPVRPVPSVNVATCGSVLVLSPSFDLSLPPYCSNGSLGQFTMQFQLELTSYYKATDVTYPFAPEIVCVCLNSGMFSTISGSSTYYSGLLNKEVVLEAQKENSQSVSDNSIMRMVGGGDLHDLSMAALKHIPILYPKIKKELLNEIQNYRGKGSSGGSSSGGARSGGRRSKLDQLCL